MQDFGCNGVAFWIAMEKKQSDDTAKIRSRDAAKGFIRIPLVQLHDLIMLRKKYAEAHETEMAEYIDYAIKYINDQIKLLLGIFE